VHVLELRLEVAHVGDALARDVLSPAVTVQSELRSHWVTVGGRPMHAYVAGDEHAPPVVLVSGLGVSARYFFPTARLLARDFLVLAPELPGSGESAKPARVLDFGELVLALDDWLDGARVPRASFIGSSMGCQILAELALRRPERIERLVFLGPTVDPHWRTLPRQLPRWLLEMAREPLSLLPIVVRDYFTFGPRRFLRAGRTALEDHLEAKLPQIRAETLVVRGEHDAFVSRSWVATVARLLPHGTCASIPHAAHAANYSAPDALVDLVRPFLLGQRQGSRPAMPIPPASLPATGTTLTPEA
jgi:2-hydroxy-6-oxonona-2,4-dienedioate hydrolase